ncbi:MAG: 3-hydroxyacyl-ACP dehydratase FabZ [Lysobacteraceae bacterium]
MSSTEIPASPPRLPLGATEIQSLLPHRYPFLLIDRVVEFEAGARILAFKNLTINEPFFQGHFPSRPVMPGVLVVEALAQAGGVLYQLTSRMNGVHVEDKLFYLVKVENARFSRMIVPGDRLELDVSIKRRIRNMALYSGVARVDGEEAACADILCAEARD